MKNEIEILRELKHPNIIKFEGLYDSAEMIYLLMEYAKGKNLLTFIKYKEFVNEDRAAKFMKYLLNAINYCHELGIIHRDIKPSNIIITYFYAVRLFLL